MIKLIGNALSLVSWVTGAISSLWTWFQKRSYIKQGRQEQQLDDLKEINEIRNDAEDIDSKPDLTPEQQLDWMRRKNKDN